MDLKQRKLNKSEWDSIEVPVSKSEIDILNLIVAGFHDVNIRVNNNKSLFAYLKIDHNDKIEEFVYNKYFRERVKAIEDEIVKIHPTYKKINVDGIVRLNSDGTLDLSYSVGSGFDGPVYRLGIQSTNKVICVGYFSGYNGNSIYNICRLNTDGTLDTTFASWSGFDGFVFDLQILSDDSIIVGGSFSTYNTYYYAPNLIKLDPEGNVDTSFTPGSGPNGQVLTVYVDTEENIYIAGNFDSYSIYGPNSGILKLDIK